MRIERGAIHHVEQWSRLRAELWPDEPPEEHRDELIHAFLGDDADAVAFIVLNDDGEAVGFAEATLRSDYVNGCDTSPVAFLEGIYVRAEDRRKGVARLLSDAVAHWGKSRDCSEFASDALLDNEASHAFHAALGFAVTERVVFFRKPL